MQDVPLGPPKHKSVDYSCGVARSWYVRYEQPNDQDNRTIFDTQIHYQIWRIETTLNINNVFDVQYEDVEDVTLPGRWIRFSLRYNL